MSESIQHPFMGQHVLGEMYGISSELLNDYHYLNSLLEKGIKESGATLCSSQKKIFQPSGLTILALLSESHASIHTYPDYGSLFFDAFTCGLECQPIKIAEYLIQGLKPKKHNLRTIMRGDTEIIPAGLGCETIESSKPQNLVV